MNSKRWGRFVALSAVLLTGCRDMKYVDMVQGECSGEWRTVSVRIANDTAQVTSACVKVK